MCPCGHYFGWSWDVFASFGQPCEASLHKTSSKLVPYWPLALVHAHKCFLARTRPLVHQQTLL